MPIVLLLVLIFTTILSAIEVGELKFSRPDYDTSFSANIEELYKIDGLLEKGMNYSVGLGKGIPLSEFDALLPTFLVTTGDFGVNYKDYSFAFSYSLANPDLGEIAGYHERGSIMLTNLNAGLIQKFRNCTFTPYASAGFQHWSPTPAEIKNKVVSNSS
ncbi:MAG: hypothetical protein JNL74_21840, partial [Fibrobacteres bacterium]|nr:hypothetical protein [Fibrobacterota bacterium]